MTQSTEQFIPPTDYMGDQRVPDHHPQLYVADNEADAQPVLGDRLTPGQLEQYSRDGFIAIRDFFTPEEVEAARQAMEDLTAGRNPRFTGLYAEAGGRDLWLKLPLEKRQDVVRKLVDFTKFDARLQLDRHPRMASVMAQLVHGPAVLFQEMALIKPPRLGREKPWHQDHAYFTYSVDTPIVGAWIALDEATVANGCMHVIRGEHRGYVYHHYHVRDWQICDREMMARTCTAVPLKPGGVLFFSSLLPHGTPTNHSEQRRRALQFHFVGPKLDRVSREEHDGRWGSMGRDTVC